MRAHNVAPKWGTREEPLTMPGMAEEADAEPKALAEKQQNQAQEQEVPAEEQEVGPCSLKARLSCPKQALLQKVAHSSTNNPLLPPIYKQACRKRLHHHR